MKDVGDIKKEDDDTDNLANNGEQQDKPKSEISGKCFNCCVLSFAFHYPLLRYIFCDNSKAFNFCLVLKFILFQFEDLNPAKIAKNVSMIHESYIR